MPVDVSVIIVNYNTRELTLACLRSVYAQTKGATFEIILVDNGSDDDSVPAIRAEFPQIILIEAGKNLGFARANNLAATQARGRYVCLLNSDTVVLDDALSRLVHFADEHPDAGAFGGRTFFPDQRLNPNSCWAAPTLWSTFCQAVGLASLFPHSSIFHSEAMGAWDRSTVRRVEIVSGCFLLMAVSLWGQLGGFDPSFFMYGEDAELCLRVNQLGLACVICPNARIIHYGGASERVRADSLTRLFRAKCQLFAKHWTSSFAKHLAVRLFDLWAIIRCIVYTTLGLFSAKYAERARIWHDIWRRRREWHIYTRSTRSSSTAFSEMTGPANG